MERDFEHKSNAISTMNMNSMEMMNGIDLRNAMNVMNGHGPNTTTTTTTHNGHPVHSGSSKKRRSTSSKNKTPRPDSYESSPNGYGAKTANNYDQTSSLNNTMTASSVGPRYEETKEQPFESRYGGNNNNGKHPQS